MAEMSEKGKVRAMYRNNAEALGKLADYLAKLEQLVK